MDPAYGQNEDLTRGADLMVSPDLGGELMESEKPVEKEVPPAAEELETELPPGDDEDQSEEEETPPLAAEDHDSGQDDTETEDREENSEEPQGKLYTVKVDGAEIQVDLNELRRGYSGQKFVQQGMQEAAAARKQAEEIYNTLQNERRQVAEYVQNVQQGLRPPPVEPDKGMFETDPLSYMEAKIQYDTELERYNTQVGQLQQVAAQQSEADKQAMGAYLTGELKQLQAIEPDFRDAETANKVKDKMLVKGQEIYGYTPQEIGQIVDHRAIRVLRDAMRYHEIQAGKTDAQEKVQHKMVKGTKTKRPTTGESRRRKQKERFKKSGDMKDAVDLLFQ